MSTGLMATAWMRMATCLAFGGGGIAQSWTWKGWKHFEGKTAALLEAIASYVTPGEILIVLGLKGDKLDFAKTCNRVSHFFYML